MSTERAAVLIDLQRWSEAKTVLTPDLADPHAGARAWCLLAMCEIGLKDYPVARRAAERAVGVDPQDEWGHRLLAIALSNLGRQPAAQKAAERAMALAPDLPESAHVLVMVLLSGRWGTGPALEIATRNLSRHPQVALAWETSAAVAAHRRDWVQAERLARGGLALDPQDTDLMMMLGRALQAQGKRAEAAESYAAATRTDPTDHRGREALGRIGMSVGGLAVALKIALLFGVTNGLLRVVRDSWRHPRELALILGFVLLLRYGVQEFAHRRAVAGISPDLRAVARRERRGVTRNWLLLVGVVSAATAGLALVDADLLALGVLIAITGAAFAVRDRRRPRTHPSDRQLIATATRNLAGQISRWRFR